MPEAIATWQWNTFLEAQAAPGQAWTGGGAHQSGRGLCQVKLCPNVQPGAVAVGWHRTKALAGDDGIGASRPNVESDAARGSAAPQKYTGLSGNFWRMAAALPLPF